MTLKQENAKLRKELRQAKEIIEKLKSSISGVIEDIHGIMEKDKR